MKLGFKSDSTGSLSVAGNAMFSSRTKHIALRFSFVRELIKRNKVTLHHKPTQQMLADIVTKHLSKQRFRELLKADQRFHLLRKRRILAKRTRRFFLVRKSQRKGSSSLSRWARHVSTNTHMPNHEREQHGPKHGKLGGRLVQQPRRKETSVSLRVR